MTGLSKENQVSTAGWTPFLPPADIRGQGYPGHLDSGGYSQAPWEDHQEPETGLKQEVLLSEEWE